MSPEMFVGAFVALCMLNLIALFWMVRRAFRIGVRVGARRSFLVLRG